MDNRMWLLKDAMDRQNAATRALLQLRSSLVRDIRKTVPQEEKNTVCVVVSLDEIRTVRSLDADDYRIRSQAGVICEVLMRCKSADELINTVRKLAQEGKVWNGQRYLNVNSAVRNVLCQYAQPAKSKGRHLALAR